MSKFAQHIVHTCTLYWLGAKRRIIPLAGGNDSSQEQDNLSNSSGQEIQPIGTGKSTQLLWAVQCFHRYGTQSTPKKIAFVFLTINTICKAR